MLKNEIIQSYVDNFIFEHEICNPLLEQQIFEHRKRYIRSN